MPNEEESHVPLAKRRPCRKNCQLPKRFRDIIPQALPLLPPFSSRTQPIYATGFSSSRIQCIRSPSIRRSIWLTRPLNPPDAPKYLWLVSTIPIRDITFPQSRRIQRPFGLMRWAHSCSAIPSSRWQEQFWAVSKQKLIPSSRLVLEPWNPEIFQELQRSFEYRWPPWISPRWCATNKLGQTWFQTGC